MHLQQQLHMLLIHLRSVRSSAPIAEALQAPAISAQTADQDLSDIEGPSDTTSDDTDYTEVTEEEVISSETNTDPTVVTETEETVETLETDLRCFLLMKRPSLKGIRDVLKSIR